MLSVHNSDAEETLDAGIIKIRIQTCESLSKRRRDTGRRNYQTRVQTCKSALSGTERKDQIRVLQTKTYEISKYLDSDARFIKIGS